MYVKTRDIPLKILLLEALLRRLRWNHPKRSLIEQELKRRKAGLWGEREVDKKLEKMDPDKYFIFSDLRLPNGKDFFQIDTLLISTHFALIIEAKTIAGTLEFDLANHQLFRKNHDGKIEGFPDPVSQARLHQQQLRKWLTENKFPQIPIDFLVIVANPNTVFYISPPNHPYAKKIHSISGLTWEIDLLEEHFKKEIISEKDLRKMSKTLLKAHTPLQSSDILRQYDISKSELLTGVHCPECEYLPLSYRQGKWFCPKCNKRFKDAHILAIQDYFLLFDSTISNSQFRKFLHISNHDIATNLLKAMNLRAEGTNKGRIYRRN